MVWHRRETRRKPEKTNIDLQRRKKLIYSTQWIYPPGGGCSITDDVPLSKTWGGDTSNAALALCKLGHRSAYITRVGDDDFGRSFLKLWQESGVDTSQAKVDQDHRTGLYFISYQDGRHLFTYLPKRTTFWSPMM